MTATFDTLQVLDARLVKAGIHPLTPWWSDQLRAYYSHPTARSLIARVGRGGAKSHTSVKVALNEVLNGDWRIPVGEVHYWSQVSESKTEAAERFRLYEAALTALGIAFDKAGDAIIIPSLRRGVRVMACQIGSVSGFRCFGYSADEAAKWENTDHSANPAKEVISSLDAMAILYPNARSLIISSPWGSDDFHAELFDRGTTREQVAVHAETWVANPAVTEQQCRDKARGDEKIFSREYAAVPGATVSQALDDADVKSALSGGNANAQWVIDCALSFDPDELRKLSLQDVVDQIAELCQAERIRYVFSDQRESAGLESMFRAKGLIFTSYAWSDTSKHDAFTSMRRLMRDHDLWIIDEPVMRRELLAVKGHLLPSGRTRYPTTGMDMLSCVVTLAHAINLKAILPGQKFCCIDPSSLRGDDFSIITGVRNGAAPERMEPLQLDPLSRWASYNHDRGFG